MKIFLASMLTLWALMLSTPAQNPQSPLPRLIDVTGSAERLVTPDEFTFRITLLERIENKQKLTIEQQEAALRRELATLGVDVAKDLSIFDISSGFLRQKKIKDVLSSKDYKLKLRDLSKIARLQEVADRLNVSRLVLFVAEFSEIEKVRREIKMEAMRAAKDKADYLLGAIGLRIGKPVYIQEFNESYERPTGSLASPPGVAPGLVVSDGSPDTSLSFSQIHVRSVVSAKFEIE